MSLKDLLVTFVTSEEASITQRSALRLGSMLTVVMLVAMVMVVMTPMPAQAETCCILVHGPCCEGGECGAWYYYDCQLNPSCQYVERSCFGGCTEYYYACAGGDVCYAICN